MIYVQLQISCTLPLIQGVQILVEQILGSRQFFFSNFYYVFPIYNSKLHDICSTSNLVHPPFKGLSSDFEINKGRLKLEIPIVCHISCNFLS